ncbi:MAG: vanillate O-demethylase oxidoreductase VanB [Myxococcales bacterium]|nr:MAG: vanillate O-demethylase oxidoreductase VanB [Myxococcales bacterium]
MNTDFIEKRALLRAPIARVWRAISDSREFGAWFRMELEGDFREGARVRGRVTYPGYEHLTGELVIQRIQPPTYLSYRWHPHAVDPQRDYSQEPMTLVEFELKEVPGGTELTLRESGFDALSAQAGRGLEALRMNSEGWDAQLENVSRHVTSG